MFLFLLVIFLSSRAMFSRVLLRKEYCCRTPTTGMSRTGRSDQLRFIAQEREKARNCDIFCRATSGVLFRPGLSTWKRPPPTQPMSASCFEPRNFAHEGLPFPKKVVAKICMFIVLRCVGHFLWCGLVSEMKDHMFCWKRMKCFVGCCLPDVKCEIKIKLTVSPLEARFLEKWPCKQLNLMSINLTLWASTER